MTAVESQANVYVDTAQAINALYQEMRAEFPEVLNSKWSGHALDYMFRNPVFSNGKFTGRTEIPRRVAERFTPLLLNRGLLREIRPSAGRRAAVYSFEPLMELIRV